MQANEVRPLLEFWQGLGIVSSSGAAGGLVSAVAGLTEGGLDDQGRYLAARGVPVWLFMVGRAIVGVGGAIAVLFAALSIGRYTSAPSSIDYLSLAALSFVAGSIGYRLLPLVAAQVERQLGEVRLVAERAEVIAQQAHQRTEQITQELDVERTVAEGRAIAEMPGDAPSLVERTRDSLERLRVQYPVHRSLNLVLASIYMKKLQNLDSAIKVLEAFADGLIKIGRRDGDLADAWFNQACYFSLEMAKAIDPSKKKFYEEKAMAALQQSISVLPSNLQDAQTDEDLGPLRATEAFKRFENPAK